ncbi:PP2C family serine/threonine-protein phosphatase [Sansalvadorimonas verongulae]|uniref:PP2C family serine/threonine-protein phosphatase n=1 Tax=Sansalvadorimonas verongulae TaxID=2172824 RepID=UPI0018AD20FC|nr:PP2C family serine/threonine-protein phosphatase [Sansalvadorimonas verongulae]
MVKPDVFVTAKQLPFPAHHVPYGHKLSDEFIQSLQDQDYQVETDEDVVQRVLKDNLEAAKEAHGDMGQKSQYRAIFHRANKRFQTEDSKVAALNIASSGVIEEFPRAGFLAAQGGRQTMEDRHKAARFTFVSGEKNVHASLVGVFDGHTNSLAAEHVEMAIIDVLSENLARYNPVKLSPAGIRTALRTTMVDLDRQISSGGTTACVAVAIEDVLWFVNVGDSRAVLLNRNGDYSALTLDIGGESMLNFSSMTQEVCNKGRMSGVSNCSRKFTDIFPLDQYPDILSEHGKKVIERGGEIILYSFQYRSRKINNIPPEGLALPVWMNYAFNLYVSNPLSDDPLARRIGMPYALGDHNLGGAVVSESQVTALECKNLKDIDDLWLVIGCDGLFDCVHTQEYAKLLQSELADNSDVEGLTLAQKAATLAIERGSTDNISVLVLPVKSMFGSEVRSVSQVEQAAQHDTGVKGVAAEL